MGMMHKNNSLTENSRSRMINQDTYQRILMMAGKLFAGVRLFFTKHVCNKLNAFFLDPMYESIANKR
jgi:hypothetical protein